MSNGDRSEDPIEITPTGDVDDGMPGDQMDDAVVPEGVGDD